MKNINHSSDDYEEEKFDIEEEKRKKPTFAESDSGAIPKNGPKYKRIICYEDSEVIQS